MKSEVVEINLKDRFFINNKIKSMRGPYIIGVYGRKDSNYTISYSQLQSSIGLIKENKPLKA